MMKTNPTKIVPVRCGEPSGCYVNRPSIEYTNHGNDIVYDGYAGRAFRASEEFVREGCKKFIAEYESGEYVCWGNLHNLWLIMVTDFDLRFGYSPSEDYKVDLQFTFTWMDKGTELYDRFGERVLLVEPCWDSVPYECFYEV